MIQPAGKGVKKGKALVKVKFPGSLQATKCMACIEVNYWSKLLAE